MFIINLLTNTNFLWFLFWVGIFGGFTAFGGGIKWVSKFISNHMTKMKQIELEAERERGRNLDKQLELEKLRRGPKPITVNDLVQEEDYSHRYYYQQEMPPQE